MTQASEVIAQQYAAAGINKVTWGSIGVNVKEFGAVGDGVTDDTQAFNRAMASITGEGTILLPPGTYRIASSMTIPSTICTYFTNGGMIAPGSGATVTINGEIIAELTQIFTGLGTVAGTFKVPCVYPQWWGAKSDGVTDCTSAFNKALSAAMFVSIPEGIYLTSGTIKIVKNGQKLIGAGTRAVQIFATNNNLPVISVNNGLNWVEVSNMTIDRNVPAIVGGHGLTSSGIVSNTVFKDLIIYNQYVGLVLGGTDWGYVQNVTVQYCYSDGIYMQNLASFPSCQWQLDTILLSQNNGSGIAVRSVAGMPVMNMGKMTKINSFSNTGYGIGIIAVPSCPIIAVRISGCFLGADGAGELYMDTYGSQHTITDVFMEQAGTEVTGRTQSTPASHVGNGIELTVNNIDVQISNCYTNAMSENGISSRATDVTVIGGSYMYSGQGGLPTKKNGIAIYAGTGLVNGARMWSNEYGFYAWDGQIATLVGCTFKNNTAAPVNIVANPTYLHAVGNKPATIGTIIPSGGVLVGAGGIGGVPADGTINVSVDIKKNNVNYTNP